MEDDIQEIMAAVGESPLFLERQRDEMPEGYVYLYTYALEDRKRVMSQRC